MALYLEVTQGTSQGARFPIRAGARIGRATGEIIIPDKKISSLHAQIEGEDGRFVLVDRGSSNGLLINNQRVKSIVLAQGVKFTLGRTTLQVIEYAEDLEGTGLGLQQNNQAISQGWQETLAKDIPLLVAQNSPDIINVQAFTQPIKLEFTGGNQANHVVVIAYGPRKFGSDVLDIELRDKSSPFLAFEISPDGNQARFTTTDFNAVSLNDRRVSTEILRDGDVIRVGSTELKVSFL
jgi:pSer/pThr/pTyr-binding forkhead associated (FHA) protein